VPPPVAFLAQPVRVDLGCRVGPEHPGHLLIAQRAAGPGSGERHGITVGPGYRRNQPPVR
jgi:hypothetical protein